MSQCTVKGCFAERQNTDQLFCPNCRDKFIETVYTPNLETMNLTLPIESTDEEREEFIKNFQKYSLTIQ